MWQAACQSVAAGLHEGGCHSDPTWCHKHGATRIAWAWQPEPDTDTHCSNEGHEPQGWQAGRQCQGRLQQHWVALEVHSLKVSSIRRVRVCPKECALPATIATHHCHCGFHCHCHWHKTGGCLNFNEINQSIRNHSGNHDL